MKIIITDPKLQRLILISPFDCVGDFVRTRFGANVTDMVDRGTPQEKCELLNKWWRERNKEPA